MAIVREAHRIGWGGCGGGRLENKGVTDLTTAMLKHRETAHFVGRWQGGAGWGGQSERSELDSSVFSK